MARKRKTADELLADALAKIEASDPVIAAAGARLDRIGEALAAAHAAAPTVPGLARGDAVTQDRTTEATIDGWRQLSSMHPGRQGGLWSRNPKAPPDDAEIAIERGESGDLYITGAVYARIPLGVLRHLFANAEPRSVPPAPPPTITRLLADAERDRDAMRETLMTVANAVGVDLPPVEGESVRDGWARWGAATIARIAEIDRRKPRAKRKP